MDGLFNLPEILIALVAGGVCGLLFADPDKRKWSFISAAIILSVLAFQSPDSARWNVALFVFMFSLCLLHVLQGRWSINHLDPSIPEIFRDLFTALEPFEYLSIESRRPQRTAVVAFVLFAIVMIPLLTLLVGTFVSGGLTFYFFWHLRGKGHVYGRIVRGVAMAAVSLFCAWQLLRPIPQRTIVEPPITESTVEVPPQPVVFYGAFVDGTTATYASNIGIVRTEDGGGTWKVVGNGRIHDFLAAYFVSPHRGWRSDLYSTKITEDAGRTWSPALSGAFMSIAFADSNNGFLGTAITKKPKNYITANGGRTWQQCGTVDQPIIRARFTNPSLLWGIALDGRLMLSEDSGCNWRAAGIVGPQEYYSDLFFLNDKEGWVTDSTGNRMLHTKDAGEHFEPIVVPGDPHYLFFQDSQNGWAILRRDRTDQIVKTLDAGLTWQSVGTSDPLPNGWSEGQLLRVLKRRRSF